MNVRIRQLGPTDAESLFWLRRQALLDSPFSFSASPEDDVWSSANAVRESMLRPAAPVVFGAIDAELIGMLGLYRAGKLKEKHRAHIWGVYVAPQCRGQGVAGRLLDAAIAHARTFEDIASLHLSVSETTPAAQRLYARCGFKVWGIEPDALRHEGRSATEHHMVLSLTAGP
jgi:ribosomal protein S18 acetylase RimI-like enzyme